MKSIYYYNSSNEFSTNERCSITELLNLPDDNNCSIARARVAPGMTTQLHALQETTERYVILKGQGEVSIDNQPPLSVSYLDTVLIPAGKAQQIANTGNDDLEFLCICTPRFNPQNYIDLEDLNEQ